MGEHVSTEPPAKMENIRRRAYVLGIEGRELLFMVQSLYNIHIGNGITTAYREGHDTGYEEGYMDGQDSEAAGRLPEYG